MGSFTVTLDLDTAKLTSMSSSMLEVLKKGQQRGIKLAADVIVGALRQTSSQGPLNARTGLLARSWKAGGINPDAEGFSVAIQPLAKDPPPGAGIVAGSNVPYSNIHEEGGEIRSTIGKKLTIPVLDNLTGKGVARYPTVEALKQAMGANKVFQFKSKAGKDLIGTADGKGKNGGLRAWFALKDSVKIPASHYVSFAITFGQDEATAKFMGALDNVK